ncbi:hypothetical protein OPKNFCMD_4139 [Methylobacterium crusticola]|uniref:SDR family NAD(P)-dependent oxidoreductase n=1 Tax=Methylobacterium crusticola TaxID=1697972 RepID=A0ABQ4R349_9HYPH|nr:type I polyketide synthase [Methylobacterium crusticola]GJD51385.1 hypothetical protein OPKNFCMD_4139 [Methylobacterium crusticola]
MSAVAVVGLACRLPGADSPEAYWRLLVAGREGIRRLDPAELAAAGVGAEADAPGYVAAKGVLDGADAFDAAFFGFSPREAALLDPQQRVFVECAWAALEDAGYAPRETGGAVGVFAGSILSTYLLQNLWPNRRLVEEAGAFPMAVGNDPTFLATRASYLLDLRGPSVSVGTACSTSLVAVHLACQSLLAHECDMALAGGVSVHLPLTAGYRYREGGILSPDGHCRPLGAAARGTVASDGVGTVVLKRLDDALRDRDCVRAVILGSAVNNDGAGKVGFTAPGIAPQARVIAEALAVAGVAPASVAMLEAHAAGTALGDPIEVAALAEVFEGAPGPVWLGSVKGNIGHVDAAAGIAGLIKAVLAVQHRTVPPSLHAPAPEERGALAGTPSRVPDTPPRVPGTPFGLPGTPFRVPGTPQAHAGPAPMRAGISAFGIGGTNVHVVIEEPPAAPAAPAAPRPELLMLSARTPAALEAATARLAAHLARHPGLPLADVAHTLRVGRGAFALRRVLVAGSTPEAAAALEEADPRCLPAAAAPDGGAPVAFLFPGLGDHYPGMGFELYRDEPVFRRAVDACADLLAAHRDGDIRDALYPGRAWARPDGEAPEAPEASEASDASEAPPGAGRIDLRAMLGRGAGPAPPAEGPADGQPMIFVTEYALARLLMSWGLVPEAMLGYSIGELVAACLADVFTLPAALGLVAGRARLIAGRVGPGLMLAVPLGEAALRARLPAGTDLAAVNGAGLCIASGALEGIAALERALLADGVACRRLPATHAYHSAMMDPIVPDLAALVALAGPRPPRIPCLSCVTGDWLTDAEATDPDYWARHLSRTVRLRDGLARLLDDPERILLEVGPGQALTAQVVAERARRPGSRNPAIPTLRWSYGPDSERVVLLRGLGRLWQAGAPLDRARLLAREGPGGEARGGPRRVPLPTYPFERRRHWIDPPGPAAAPEAPPEARRPLGEWVHLPCWRPSIARPDPAAGMAGSGPAGGMAGPWLVLLDREGVGAALAGRLPGAVVAVAQGARTDLGGEACTLDPSDPDAYRALARTLRRRGAMPRRVVHLWSLAPAGAAAPSRARFAAAQATGFHALMQLLQALWAEGQAGPLRVDVAASGLFDVTGREALAPERATLLGPVLVAPQERPGLACRLLDVEDPGAPDLPALILAELAARPDAPAVALRQGRRFVQAHAPVRLDAPAGPPFRERGVYLVTGGLGGVGLALARHLADAVRARLVLLGRTALPDRAAWPRRFGGDASAEAGDPRVRDLVRQVIALEARGAEVLTLAADVADEDALARALAAAEARFGALHGVFHCAGSVGPQAFREIARASPADAEAQFAAKAYGTLALDRALAGRTLDFCALASSLSGVLGGLGFSGYAAANLFLDAFAPARRRAGGTPWISIAWDSWRLPERRGAVEGLGATVSGFGMAPEEGAEICARILGLRAEPRAVVSTGDLAGRLAQWVTREEAPAPAPLAPHARPDLRLPYAAPRGEVEEALAAIWSELFAVAPIGIHDNFFELGGHSLLATQLNARIAARLGVEMSLAALLQAPTVAALAPAVVAAKAARADPEALARILAELGGLPADDPARPGPRGPDTQAAGP